MKVGVSDLRMKNNFVHIAASVLCGSSVAISYDLKTNQGKWLTLYITRERYKKEKKKYPGV